MAVKWKLVNGLKKVFTIKYFDDGKCRAFLKLPLYSENLKTRIMMALPIKYDSSIIYHILYGFEPIINNKIVFDNYMGKGFGCNSKAVAEKLLEKYPGEFEIVWLATKGNSNPQNFPEEIKIVDYASPEARKEFATAKVWVSNYHKISMIRKGLRKKKDQFFIQMWHGSLGIKKIENDVQCLTEQNDWLRLAKMSSRMTDYWISNSKFETQVYKRAFWEVSNVLEYGHPRNDMLINEADSVQKRIKENFGIEGKKVLFYAPTFREDYRLDCYQLDYERLKVALRERFGGEWVFFIRLHPRVQKYASKVIPEMEGMYDVTKYPDIQELIAAADCMITDYSSCIFDYLLMKKPGFLFATDIEEYNTERGFYYPLESTPFPIAQDNDELITNIKYFDIEIYKQKCDTFLVEKGCVEDGNASERVADLIAQIVGIKEEK